MTADVENIVARRASRTAQLMAVQRALESARPAQTRLFSDHLAPQFVSPAWRMVLLGARVEVVRRGIEAIYDLVGGPGPRASAVARTRLIDDIIVDASPDQLVILGAGYDTRAQRLDCLVGSSVYEIDHANTQAHKRAVLAHAGPSAVREPKYVAVDFERDDLARTLNGAGLTSEGRTVFLWEGVTQYLSPEAVDRALSAVRFTARRGDTLVFTYVDEAALGERDDRFPEAAKWLRGTCRRGEPWIFGLSPSRLGEYLQARGFNLVSDLSTREAGDRYFVPRQRPEQGSDLYHVVTATVS